MIEQGIATMNRFAFQSGTDRLVGSLFLPSNDPIGLVVTTGPLTSVKEQVTGTYAKALAGQGFAALAFDHRCFGESEGRPRQLENPFQKIADVHAAVAAMRDDEDYRHLPMLGLGICAGGGYMAAAVAGSDIFSGFAGVAGYYADAAATRQWMGERYTHETERAKQAAALYERTGEATMIPAVAADGGDVAMPLREAYDYYGTARGQVGSYVNGFAAQSRLYTLPFDAQSAAGGIRVPSLIVHSDNALAPQLAQRFFDAVGGRKAKHWITTTGQVDFYDNAAVVDEAAQAIAAFWQSVIER
jgi:uncharacterized protein